MARRSLVLADKYQVFCVFLVAVEENDWVFLFVEVRVDNSIGCGALIGHRTLQMHRESAPYFSELWHTGPGRLRGPNIHEVYFCSKPRVLPWTSEPSQSITNS